jgi:hypothetical protein
MANKVVDAAKMENYMQKMGIISLLFGQETVENVKKHYFCAHPCTNVCVFAEKGEGYIGQTRAPECHASPSDVASTLVTHDEFLRLADEGCGGGCGDCGDCIDNND